MDDRLDKLEKIHSVGIKILLFISFLITLMVCVYICSVVTVSGLKWIFILTFPIVWILCWYFTCFVWYCFMVFVFELYTKRITKEWK